MLSSVDLPLLLLYSSSSSESSCSPSLSHLLHLLSGAFYQSFPSLAPSSHHHLHCSSIQVISFSSLYMPSSATDQGRFLGFGGFRWYHPPWRRQQLQLLGSFLKIRFKAGPTWRIKSKTGSAPKILFKTSSPPKIKPKTGPAPASYPKPVPHQRPDPKSGFSSHSSSHRNKDQT